MKIIDGLIFHRLPANDVSYYEQNKKLVKQMKSRMSLGLCRNPWCPDLLFKDGLCKDHYEEATKPKAMPTKTQVDTKICRTVNCGEFIVKESLCSGCYTVQLEELTKKPRIISPEKIKQAEDLAKELDTEAVETMANLEWWYEHYQEQELPAKFINPDFYLLEHWDSDEYGEPDKYRFEMANLSKRESMWLIDKLKELDGAPVNNGTHIWTFVGRKHFKREGQQNLFACIPAGV